MKTRPQRLIAGMMFGFTIGLAVGAAFGHWTWMLAMGLSMAFAFSHIFMGKPEKLEE